MMRILTIVHVQCDLHVACGMYLVLYFEHYLQHASPCVLKLLISRYPTLFGETIELVEGVGHGRNGMSHGLDMIKAHRWQTSFEVSLHHINAEKCAL
jgi:hypothetical protein